MVANQLEPWFNAEMLKSKAIELLGGTTAAAAKAIGVTYQAIDKWPDELPPRLADRVLAALARDRLLDVIGEQADPTEDAQ